jgi:lysophospholipase L1-like esterase
MKLLAVGDSFTFGEELEDHSLAWPYLLGNKLGWTVTNLGQRASGNTRMVRTVVENVNNFDVFIIAWSHWARIEFADKQGIFDIWPGCNSAPYQNLTPHRTQLIDYITRHHSDEYLIKQYSTNIILLQNYLESKGKKYIMLNAFGKSKNLNLNINKEYFLGWPNETMVEWTYGCPKGPGGHFLEQGHKIVADKIYEYIRHLGWIS